MCLHYKSSFFVKLTLRNLTERFSSGSVVCTGTQGEYGSNQNDFSFSFFFQVPDRFLEVAEITLHEFYNAVAAAKDSDPSWKKAIYKVICKLDSDVPEEFKTSSYL